jgi:hypothetical protein
MLGWARLAVFLSWFKRIADGSEAFHYRGGAIWTVTVLRKHRMLLAKQFNCRRNSQGVGGKTSIGAYLFNVAVQSGVNPIDSVRRLSMCDHQLGIL